jgi:hypothetical protein
MKCRFHSKSIPDVFILFIRGKKSRKAKQRQLMRILPDLIAMDFLCQAAGFGCMHGYRGGVADVAPAGEVPFVGEASALTWLYWVDATGVAFEHDTFVVGFLDERETLPIGAESRVLLQKRLLGDAKKIGHAWNVFVFEAHIAGPFAAGGAALADVKVMGIKKDIAIARGAVIWMIAHGLTHLPVVGIDFCQECAPFSPWATIF